MAQLKAAAWGLVAAVGVYETIKILNSLASEIENTLWSDRQGGDR